MLFQPTLAVVFGLDEIFLVDVVDVRHIICCLTKEAERGRLGLVLIHLELNVGRSDRRPLWNSHIIKSHPHHLDSAAVGYQLQIAAGQI